jgi:transcriptional regulator with XRE-family HTH domain
VSIGETLARARRDAGLSIAEISGRTRLRQSVIDAIEHDNYSACGGDERARCDITAMARELGLDSGPLTDAYDAARQPAEWIVASEPSEPSVSSEPSEPRVAETPLVTPDEDTEPITIGESVQPIRIGEPVHPITIGEPAYPITPAGAAVPARPAWLAYADRRLFMWIALGALLLVAAIGGILVVVGSTGPARTLQPPPSHSVSSPGRTRPTSPATSRPVQALVPASIAAFGPGGAGQGDSPQLARRALAGKAAGPWHSAWYTTPHFGNLQSGTGLLLDMGRTVTITSARISLGNRSGADLALRVGNSPALASLPPVARANGVGGVVRLKTAPTRGRYVLVWFTRLPPDQAGTFEVSVFDIKLRGRR